MGDSDSIEETTDPHAWSRLRAAVTVLVTLMIVLAEFWFLTAVYHLGDNHDQQRLAQAELAGVLAASPAAADGDAARTVGSAIRELVDSGLDRDDVAPLQAAAADWSASPADVAALQDLRAETDRLGTTIAARQSGVDRTANLIHATVLVLVSIGWFFWFRKLVRRHREVQRALTQKQAVDAGERRLLALVQNSADLVIVMEPDSTASFVSPSARAVLGRAPEMLIDGRITDLLHHGDVPGFVEKLLGSREGDQGVRLRMAHADGRTLVVEGTLTDLLADPAVNGWVLTVRDVTDAHVMQEQLTYQAFHDSLTGLANRHLFADRLAHALRRRNGAPEQQVVLFCDLDDFKNVNDSLGHGVGDRLLVAVGERITAAIREGDTAARLGGDEFAVLMEGAEISTANAVADRLLHSLRDPVVVDGVPLSVSASIGMAAAMSGSATSDEVLRNADVAMYWAKDRGKATVAVYDRGLHAQASARLAMRTDLKRAIREDELVLHYQPKIELATGRITGFEALVRWDHPEQGLLAPMEFVPTAEQTGTIVSLGGWVLDRACRAAAGMQTGEHRPTIAVNVAAQQLAEDDFITQVTSTLTAAGLAPDRLVLEITESVLLGDLDTAVERLAALRELGIRIAIDDFGTGYSSLAYLARLPVDVLKVDKSFVDQVITGAHGASVTEAIITMGQRLGLVTVAEGVELPEQAAWLQQLGCTLGQGYLWSRPVELCAARHLLHEDVRVPYRETRPEPAAS